MYFLSCIIFIFSSVSYSSQFDYVQPGIQIVKFYLVDTEPKLFNVFILGCGFNPGPGYSLLCPTVGPGVQPRVKTSKSFWLRSYGYVST